MKILKLKDPAHNKLFHLEKMRKAEVIKINPNDHHFHSAPKLTPSPPTNNHPKSSKDPNSAQHPNLVSTPAPNKTEPKPPQRLKATPSLLESAQNEQVNIPQQTTSQPPPPPTPIAPEKPKLVTTSIE